MKKYSFANVGIFINGTEVGGYCEGADVITAERLNSAANVNQSDKEVRHNSGLSFKILGAGAIHSDEIRDYKK